HQMSAGCIRLSCPCQRRKVGSQSRRRPRRSKSVRSRKNAWQADSSADLARFRCEKQETPSAFTSIYEPSDEIHIDGGTPEPKALSPISFQRRRASTAF